MSDSQHTMQRYWLAFLLIATLLAGLWPQSDVVAQATHAIQGPVVVRPGGAQLYAAPEGEVIATLSTSTIFTATGRTEDELWIVGQAATSERGWLQTAQVIAVGVELLPVTSVEAAAPVVNEGASEAASPSPATSAMTESVTTSPSEMSTEIMGTVASGDDRLNVRGGPGTAYAILAKAMPGEQYAVLGRTADGAWLLLDLGNEETGWVSASYMLIAGNVTAIPVVEATSPPVATPRAVTPTSSTPTAVTQTAAPSGAAVSGLRGTITIQSSPGGMIYAYSLDSGALWPLTNGFDPAISADGQTVAFVRDGGENGIYLIEIDGSNERLIWSGRTRLSSPKWSPDGQWIAFTRSDGEYHCLEIGSNCISPPSSPDGREISVPGADTVTRYWYNLARVDRDGNNYRDIASLSSARAADWNTAGIVYQSNAGLQITDDVPDAENKLVIFDYLKPFFDDPDWQPDGGRIVYMGKEASHWELFAVNPDGSGETALTRPASTVVDEIPSNVAPAWSPDGQHILFLSNRTDSNSQALYNGDAPGTGAWRVWVMEADGSNQRALPIDVEINYTFGGEQALSWAQ